MILEDREPARIALLALRASLESSEATADAPYLFLPSRRPILEEELIDLLAESAKLVACIALSLKGAIVAVAAWPQRSATTEYAFQREQAEEAVSEFKRLYRPSDSSIVEVRTPERAMLTAWRDFERWLLDYDIIFGGYSITEPDRMSQAQAIAIATFAGNRNRQGSSS